MDCVRKLLESRGIQRIGCLVVVLHKQESHRKRNDDGK